MDISGKSRYGRELNSLASGGGSIARAWLAVLRCPLLGVPIVPRLALLTPRANCVVLAVLKGRAWLSLAPLGLQIPGVGRVVGLTWQAPVSGSQTSVWPWQLQRSQVPR